jgi:hypothetical protein
LGAPESVGPLALLISLGPQLLVASPLGLEQGFEDVRATGLCGEVGDRGAGLVHITIKLEGDQRTSVTVHCVGIVRLCARRVRWGVRTAWLPYRPFGV